MIVSVTSQQQHQKDCTTCVDNVKGDSGCIAMGVSQVFFVCRDGCVAGFGAVDVRANGTIDHGTRATNARAEATANMELTDPVNRQSGCARPLSPANLKVPNPCHTRTRKCWTLSPANLHFKQAKGATMSPGS